MKTNIKLLDAIELTTRRYLRARARAKSAIEDIALSISCAPSDTGIRTGGHSSRTEAGALMQAEAEQKAEALHEELEALRRQLKPYAWKMKYGPERSVIRLYYLRGRSLKKIAAYLHNRDHREWTVEMTLDALQRGIEELRELMKKAY